MKIILLTLSLFVAAASLVLETWGQPSVESNLVIL
jgi:hypothetical protein